LNSSDIALIVSEFNRLLGEISIVSNYSCINTCEACFTFANETSETCGTVRVDQSGSIQGREGNFTIEEIASFSDASLAEVFDQVSSYSNNCIDYTTSPYIGSLCLTVEYMGFPDENDTVYCNITYDNELCNSCTIQSDSIQSDCMKADCTNIYSAAMIDVCNDTGLVGPFQFFAFENMDIDNTTFTVGKCTPVRAPTANGRAPTSSTSDSYLFGFSLIPLTSLTLISIVLAGIL
jgi:hypothetical protein